MSRKIHDDQKSLQSCWQNRAAVEQCDLVIAKWMIDASISFNVINFVCY
jgi:hypothetical protein